MSKEKQAKFGEIKPAGERELKNRLRREITFGKPVDITTRPFPADLVRVSQALLDMRLQPPPLTVFKPPVPVLTFRPDRDVFKHYFELEAARKAIEAKAAALGVFGVLIQHFRPAGSGYVISYEYADIYYSGQTGAHEVYGAIKTKYDLLGGASSILGLPVTGEEAASGAGRRQHFQGGSIYWSPNTGPMMVRGPVRDLWFSQGAEGGHYGYPVSDTHRKTIFDPIHNPDEYTSVFQNGAIYSKGDNPPQPALVAKLEPWEVSAIIRGKFDNALKQVDSRLGIEGGVNISRVSDWGYDIWASRNRVVTFAINGFFDAGLLPDPTFYVELPLIFDLTWNGESLVEPLAVTASLGYPLSVSATVFYISKAISIILYNVISAKFKDGYRIEDIPAIARLIDIIVTPEGGINFLLEPNIEVPVEGEIRRVIFQDKLNSMAES